MSRIIKSLLASVTAALVIAGASATATFAQSAPPVDNAAPNGTISVTGVGLVNAQPTVARITVGVEVQNASLAAAVDDASTRMTAVVQQLKAAGIADQDIHTVTFDVSPQYNSQNGQSTLTGYQVRNYAQARVTNLSTLGSLIDTVVGAGATRVSSIQFESDDPSAIKVQARDAAMQDARAEADQLAQDAGVSLGKAVSVSETDTNDVTPQQQTPSPSTASVGASATTPVQPGQLQVRATVQVSWAIQ